MDVEINCAWNKICNDLLQLSSEIFDTKDDKSSLVKLCKDFEENWNISVDTSNLPFKSIEEVKYEFDKLVPLLMRQTKRCLVIGRAKVGKSTLINALLTENVLPIGDCCGRSSCVVHIKGNSNKRNYIIIDNRLEIDIKELINLNDIRSDKCLAIGSNIDLFYDISKCELLKEGVTIIDTPGIDALSSEDDHCSIMVDRLKDADVIILVLDAVIGLSDSERNFLQQYKNRLSKSKLLIVYNRCDVISSDDDRELVTDRLIDETKKMLSREFDFTIKEVLSSIFFVSALERINIFSEDIIKNIGPLWDVRNDSFASFTGCLKKKLSENVFTSKYRCLVDLYSIPSSLFSHCQFSVSQMREKRVELSMNIKAELNDVTDLNGRINHEISIIFGEAYEDLIGKCLSELKQELQRPAVTATREEFQNDNLVCYNVDEEEILRKRMGRLLEDIVKCSLSTLRDRIINFVSIDDEYRLSFRKKILTELYFPFYFDLSNEISFFDLHSFTTNLLEINRRIKIGSRVTIGLTAGAAAVGVATGGVAFAVIGLAEAALVAGGVAGGGALAGSAIGFGTSFGIIRTLKMPFRFAWKKYELNIKVMWDSFESTLTNSYALFLENMTANITQLISSTEERSKRVEYNLNNVKEELKNFQNYSLIY